LRMAVRRVGPHPPTPAGHPTKRHRPQGPKTSVAGGRTSVSAPLVIDPKFPAPLGSETSWTGNPIRAHQNIARKGIRTSVAGARTSVSARLVLIRKPPPPWAAKPLGPKI